MTVYATPGPITGTVVVTDSGGITHTESIYSYNGTSWAGFPWTARSSYAGPTATSST